MNYPDAAFLFVLFLPLVWSILWQFAQGKASFIRMKGNRTARSMYERFLIKWFFSSASLLLFLLMVILSLLGFHSNRVGSKQVPPENDLIFAVDISRSMLAEDLRPNRLERAKQFMLSMLESASNTRFGLLVFTDASMVMVPVSEDRLALQSALDALSPGLISARGTDLSSGLKLLRRSFPGGEDRNRIAILLSDGEHHIGNPSAVAKEFSRERIRLFTIGMASSEGAPVPDGSGGYISDADGERVISRLNSVVLEALAQDADGRFIEYSDETALRELRQLLSIDEEGAVELSREELYRPFLLLALFFLAVHAIVRILPWQKS